MTDPASPEPGRGPSGDPTPPADEAPSSGRGAILVQVLVLVVIGVVSAVQVGVTVLTDDPLTWRTAVQAFLAVTAPVTAASRVRHRPGR